MEYYVNDASYATGLPRHSLAYLAAVVKQILLILIPDSSLCGESFILRYLPVSTFGLAFYWSMTGKLSVFPGLFLIGYLVLPVIQLSLGYNTHPKLG